MVEGNIYFGIKKSCLLKIGLNNIKIELFIVIKIRITSEVWVGKGRDCY